jgi:hypothetical protein
MRQKKRYLQHKKCCSKCFKHQLLGSQHDFQEMETAAKQLCLKIELTEIILRGN